MFVIKEGTAPDKVGEGTPPEVLSSISKYLEKTGYVVRTTDQEKEYLASKTQEGIDKVLGERNSQMEATIFETTGIQKTAGEKFHEYHKRAVAEKLGEVATLKAKIKEFEEKGTSGSALAQQYKAELEAAQKTIKDLNADWEKKFSEKDSEVFKTKVSSEIEKEIAIIKSMIDPSIPKNLHDDIIAARLNKFNGENVPASLEGLLIFKDSKGVTYTSKKDGKPEKLSERLTPYFEDVLDKKRTQGGSGSGEGGAGGGGTPPSKWKEIVLPETVKTQTQLTDYLMKTAKIDPNTKDYSEAFENLKGDLPLR
jgi:hypothetical protein